MATMQPEVEELIQASKKIIISAEGTIGLGVGYGLSNLIVTKSIIIGTVTIPVGAIVVSLAVGTVFAVVGYYYHSKQFVTISQPINEKIEREIHEKTRAIEQRDLANQSFADFQRNTDIANKRFEELFLETRGELEAERKTRNIALADAEKERTLHEETMRKNKQEIIHLNDEFEKTKQVAEESKIKIENLEKEIDTGKRTISQMQEKSEKDKMEIENLKEEVGVGKRVILEIQEKLEKDKMEIEEKLEIETDKRIQIEEKLEYVYSFFDQKKSLEHENRPSKQLSVSEQKQKHQGRTTITAPHSITYVPNKTVSREQNKRKGYPQIGFLQSAAEPLPTVPQKRTVTKKI